MNSQGQTHRPQRPGIVLLPPSLVRGEQFQLDPALWAAVSLAERELGTLGGYARAREDPESVAELMLLRESALSNGMEGGRASLGQILWWRTDQHLEEADASLRGELRLAAYYLEAWSSGVGALSASGYSTKLVRAVHSQLFRRVRGRDTVPGKLRDSEIWIGPAGSTFETAWFVPPAPGLVPDAMSALQRFLTTGEAALPLCLRVAIAYYQLETIHPFVDGNGRVARMLVPLLLDQQPGVPAGMLSLSAFFNRDRTEHFRQLQLVRERGEWSSWFTYFLEAVAASASESLVIIEKIHTQILEDRNSVAESLGGASVQPALRLLKGLVAQPLQSVTSVARLTGRTFANANQLVGKLEGMGIFKEITGRKRNRRYCYSPVVDLLAPTRTGQPT